MIIDLILFAVSGSVKMDILGGLHQRDIYQAIRLIFRNCTFQMVVKMQYVCKGWHEIITAHDAWRLLLFKDYQTCPKFRKTCDAMGWSKYLLKKETPEPNQLKYISFTTQYISKKQRM